MRSKRICVYRVDDPATAALGDYKIVATPENRQELRTVIGGEKIDVLIIDLDATDALDAVVEVLEINTSIAVVGVLAGNDVQKFIAAQRAGCRQVACKPLNENDLAMAVRKSLNEANSQVDWGKTLAVIGASGGVGSTTISCYLAMSLAEASGTRAAIIDLDLEFGTVASLWDVNPRYTIGDLATAGAVDTLLIEDAIIDLPCSVAILPRPAQMDQAQAIHEGIVKNIFDATRSLYPYVVIDLPRRLDEVTGCAIQACDKLIIVVESTVTSVDNASRLTESLIRFGLPHETLEYVLNRHSKGIHAVSVEDLEGRVGKKVLGVVPNNYKALSAASDMGQPVAERNTVRKAIVEIAGKLCGHRTAETTGGGWMSSLKFGRSSRPEG